MAQPEEAVAAAAEVAVTLLQDGSGGSFPISGLPAVDSCACRDEAGGGAA
ncbi:hypothetical protein ACI784_22060 [Geodermatophilus sp. SYSU D01186]